MTRSLVFVDTWAYVALAVRDDPNHRRAADLGRRLEDDGALLVTTNYVVGETITRLRLDAGLALALGVAELVAETRREGRLRLLRVSEDDEGAALNWLRRFTDHRLSFTDCTSFAVMAREGIQEAFTADRHFAVAGFTPLV